jgi:uncharacterized protein
LAHPPSRDEDVAAWVADLGLPGLVDIHTHFLPERVLHKVWEYFDSASEHYGMEWPVHYRHDERTRLRVLRDLGVRLFAPLVYPHKPGMADWLNSWALDFGQRTPGAVPTATLYPEPGVVESLVPPWRRGRGASRCTSRSAGSTRATSCWTTRGAFSPRPESR